jgi:hydrogenase maturation protease
LARLLLINVETKLAFCQPDAGSRWRLIKRRRVFVEETMDATPQALVLGIGNLLWADEGFGVRAVEALDAAWSFSGPVRVMDGGTQGLYLLDHVCSANILVVFDAVDYGLSPGALKCVEGEEAPRFLGVKKISLHQTGFQEVLASAEMLGRLPRHLLLIGVQPVELDDYGGSLTPVVKSRIGPAIAIALDYLGRFGIKARPRRTPAGAASSELALESYERGRPSARDACRLGDERVIARAYQGAHERAYAPGDAAGGEGSAHGCAGPEGPGQGRPGRAEGR